MELLTTILELCGTVLLVAGVGMVSIPAAFIVAGIALIGIGYLASPSRGQVVS